LTKLEKPPTSGESVSALPHEDRKNDSVLYFLYHDYRRIASFLAQFETYGILQQVKATESVGRTESSRTSHSAGVDLVTVAKAGVAIDSVVSDDEKDSAERTYDPLWTNARTFMDYLAERNMIQRDLSHARIGQFVLVSGTLSVIDLSLNKIFFRLPELRKRISKLTGEEMLKNAPTQDWSAEEMGSLATLLVDELSHSTVATLQIDESTAIWGVLIEKFMVVSAADFLLKHGLTVEGNWSILGILDAHPSPRENATDQPPSPPAKDVPWSKLAEGVTTFARRHLGRPATAYGVTPLLIFRGVSG